MRKLILIFCLPHLNSYYIIQLALHMINKNQNMNVEFQCLFSSWVVKLLYKLTIGKILTL